MQEMILCKLGEVVLKGLNRRSFEMKLMSNIRRRTQRFGKFRIYSRQSTIYVEPCEESCDLEGAYDACKKVFGIIAITRAQPCEKSKEAILETAKLYLAGRTARGKELQGRDKARRQELPHGLHSGQPVGRRRAARRVPAPARRRPPPGADGLCRDPRGRRLCPCPRRERRGRPGRSGWAATR